MRVSPVEHEIPADYQYRVLTSGWALQRAWHRARLDLVEAIMPPSASEPSLDAAAGAGILARRFSAAPIVSTDIRMAACRYIRSAPGSRMSAVGTLANLPFLSGVFAQVYFLEVIEHLERDAARQVLRELRRVCAPRGRCLITTPNYASHWGLLERAIDALRLTPPMSQQQHVSRYTARLLGDTVQSAGWRVMRAGSFNLIAPVAGALSARAGRWAVRAEVEKQHGAGALLYALCDAS